MFRLFLLFLLCLTGCICDQDRFRTPNLLHPGHITEQQKRMEQSSPFARTDTGPTIVGDRPSGSLEQTPPISTLPRNR